MTGATNRRAPYDRPAPTPAPDPLDLPAALQVFWRQRWSVVAVLVLCLVLAGTAELLDR